MRYNYPLRLKTYSDSKKDLVFVNNQEDWDLLSSRVFPIPLPSSYPSVMVVKDYGAGKSIDFVSTKMFTFLTLKRFLSFSIADIVVIWTASPIARFLGITNFWSLILYVGATVLLWVGLILPWLEEKYLESIVKESA